jgi:uncharacterized protein
VNPATVITGASSGIGRELARVAARERDFLVLIGQRQQALDELAAELAAGGAQVETLSIDLTNAAAGDQIERVLAERGVYCDVLVNSAGFGMFGPAVEMPRDEQLRLFDLNARAVTDLSLRFLPAMVARGRGGILNVGSLTGYSPGPYMALYYASKAYVRSFSAALAVEVANTGVTVTCLSPGPVRTPFFDRCKVGQTRLTKIMPRANAPETAEAGWRGFKQGKAVVIPRLIDRIIVSFFSVLPASMLGRIVGILQRPRNQ